MSERVTGRALRNAAFVGLVAGASALSGCSSMGLASLDRASTGSVASNAPTPSAQLMPRPLAEAQVQQVAEGPFIPPEDIAGGPGVTVIGPAPASLRAGAVSSEDLPLITSNAATESPAMMPAAQPMTPVAVPKLASIQQPAATPTTVPSDAYVHMIEPGESLYTIARRYNVTAQAIIQANGFSSPDKIFVGQKIVIPGRADLLGKMDAKVAAVTPTLVAPAAAATPVAATPAAMPVDSVVPAKRLAAVEPAAKPVVEAAVKPAVKTPAKVTKPVEVASVDTKAVTPAATPVAKDVVKSDATDVASAKPLVQPKVEPVLSGADRFRWPISGRVITDFANSKGTGINIEAPEGAAVRAAENGQVIYAGSGVEGYGNLILIRHPNGYVSAYAHLKDMNVAKGTVVNRGDNIGTAGMTGSVSKPQLHFELRKGATPVDPIPLLAS